MKILWLSHLIPYPPKGGVLQRAYYLIKEISKYHQVDVLAFNQSDLISPYYEFEEAGINDARKHLHEFCNRIDIFEIPSEKEKTGKHVLALKSLFTNDPFNINWLKSEKYGQKIKTLVAENNYDIVHIDTISLIPYFSLVKHLPVVLDHHNIESQMLIRRADKESNIIKSWYYRQEGRRLEKIEKDICPKVTLNVTCSTLDSERLKEIAVGSNIKDIPNGVDQSQISTNINEAKNNEKNLLFIGTLNWYPNIEAVNFIAEKIWPNLKAKYPGIKFDVVGAHPPGNIIKLSEVDSDFRVHGYVDDIESFYRNASIFICPIQDGGGTKLKILDAMARGKAIIAHPVACEGINVEDSKNIVFAEDVDEYVSNIVRLFNNVNMIEEIGQEARKLIEENYTFTMIGSMLSSAYEECINNKQ